MSYNDIFLYFLLLFAANKLIDKILALFKAKDDCHRLLSSRFFASMSQSSLTSWCFNFLKEAGFDSLSITDNNGGIHMPAMTYNHEGSSAFIWIIHKNCSTQDDFESVSSPEMEEICGYILLNDIKKATVITDGTFDEKAADFASSFSDKFDISFIDGCSLAYNYTIFHGGECIEF